MNLDSIPNLYFLTLLYVNFITCKSGRKKNHSFQIYINRDLNPHIKVVHKALVFEVAHLLSKKDNLTVVLMRIQGFVCLYDIRTSELIAS